MADSPTPVLPFPTGRRVPTPEEFDPDRLDPIEVLVMEIRYAANQWLDARRALRATTPPGAS